MKLAQEQSWRGVVEMIRRTYTAAGRQQSGLYSIEGTRLVERALRANVPIERVLLSEQYAADTTVRVQQLLTGLRTADCRLTTAPNSIMAELTHNRNLGQIIALAPLPHSQLTIDHSPLTIHPSPLLLVAHHITDPGNTGALIRTAHAAGATALITTGSTDPYHPRAVLTSRGSLFKLPLLHYESANPLLDDLQRHDIMTIGTAATGGTPLPDVVFPQRGLAIFVGNEGQGLPEAMTAALDLLVTIPMSPGVDSFAVNAAAAIILYAASQQTKQNPTRD